MAIQLGVNLPRRLEALEEPQSVLEPEEQQRCQNDFRMFVDRTVRRGANLEPFELHLLWLGWWQSRCFENLQLRMRLSRERSP